MKIFKITEHGVTWCADCYHPKTLICGALKNGVCTRKKGHKGPHKACGVAANSHPIEIWKDYPPTP